MSKQTTTKFEKRLEEMLIEWESGNPVISAFRVDARTRSIKRAVSELVRECIGEDEKSDHIWRRAKQECREEIRERFRAKGIEV